MRCYHGGADEVSSLLGDFLGFLDLDDGGRGTSVAMNYRRHIILSFRRHQLYFLLFE
jgi:hypothetical protein